MNDLIIAPKTIDRGLFSALAGMRKEKIDDGTPLMALNTLTQAKLDLFGTLVAQSHEQAKNQARVLLGSYPNARPDDPDIYVRAITSVFEDVPADIGGAAVDKITRANKFPPTRAELLEVVESMMLARRGAMRVIDEQMAEHERRKHRPAYIADMTKEERKAFADKVLAENGYDFRKNPDLRAAMEEER